MKKSLVFMLVLGMATMANAALTVTLSGPSTLNEGEVGTYTVGYSDATILSADVDIISTAGSIGGGVILVPASNRDSALDVIGINGATGNYEIAIMNDVLALDLGSPLMSFELTAPMGSQVVTLSLLENSFFDLDWGMIEIFDQMPSMDVQIIPEPATIALLGLGGLLLRRRK